jgi:3-oxoacyl-[acyl-carrier protein] reductase
MNLNLTGKTCLITGPAKGMGAAISRAFAAEGCKLALAGRDTAAIAPIQAEILAAGGAAFIAGCDLTDPAQCVAAAEQTLAAYGRIDILVNVAGGAGPIGKSGMQTTPEEFDQIVTLNMNGCFHTMRAVLPAMVAQEYGKIVNVGGTFGMRGQAGRVSYSASKWGLRGLTKSFALEVGVHNINVNCVAPGMVEGERFRGKVIPEMAKRLGITEDQAVARYAQNYALKRITTDEDVAQTCLFLASDVSRQITGADLAVDGGWAAL